MMFPKSGHFQKRLAMSASLFAVLMIVPVRYGHAELAGWSTNVDEAMKQATEENKGLLLNFSGSDWCSYCIQLGKEVFGREEFRNEAQRNFVLVELDFPNDRSELLPETAKQNSIWQSKLNVDGFPMVFLADSKGRPYARTGYRPGGPEEYLQHLAELRTICRQRDEYLEKAAIAKGISRAKLLDLALESVGPHLAFTAYADEIEEIIELDADDAVGLRSRYEGHFGEEIFRQLLHKIPQVLEQEGPDAALSEVDETQQRYLLGGDFAIQLAILKAHLFEDAGRMDDAIELFDDLIKSREEVDEKVRLYFYKANMLDEHDRTDDAVAAIDKALVLTADDSIKQQLERYKNSLIPRDEAEKAAE